MKDLISIIIPFYNSGTTLKNCIESILNQTINNYEIILINNSSNDSSTQIAIDYSNKYKFIHYYNIKERNVSTARNTGLANSNGNIICFIDSDDLVHKNYLKIMYNNFKSNDLIICNYSTKIFLLNDKIKKNKVLNKTNCFNSILKNKKIKGYVWNKFFKKEIIDNNNITFNNKLKIGEDTEFVFNYLKFCKKIVFIDSKLYYYNNSENNTVNNVNNYENVLYCLDHIYHEYKKYNCDKNNLQLINYYYLKKYYEIKYYNKNFNNYKNIYFSNKLKFNYKFKLFLYKNFTQTIIIIKKVRNKI